VSRALTAKPPKQCARNRALTGVFALISGTLLPAGAWAEVCDKVRPFWTPGTEATALNELIHLAASPASLLLLLLSALAIAFRSQWGGLLVVIFWTIWVSVILYVETGGEVRQIAVAEGCVGSPTLFIAAVTAICVAMILYTTPRPSRG
jgi:hypothetical protein